MVLKTASEIRKARALEHFHALTKALVIIHFSVHRLMGDGRDLVVNAFEAREFVDDFALDQSRIHVEDDEAFGATIEPFGLKRDVDAELLGDAQEFFFHGILGALTEFLGR